MTNENNLNDHVEEPNNMAHPVRGTASNGETATNHVEDDVRIIEETITHVATKPDSPSLGGPPSAKPPATPVAAPTPAPPAPPISRIPSIAPSTPPAPPAELRQDPETLNTDIAKILKGVGLPERRLPAPAGALHAGGQAGEEKGAADTKIPPSSLGQGASEAKSAAVLDAIPPNVTPRVEEGRQNLVSPVHTLKDDLQSVVRDKKISAVRAVSLEEDRRARERVSQAETPATVQRTKRTFAIVFSVALLFVIGATALFGVYTIMQERTGKPPIQTSTSVLFSEQSVLFSLDNRSPNDLQRALGRARNASTGTLGSITRIIPVIATTNADGAAQNIPATFSEFLGALGAHAPDDLIRALRSDFFFGIHTVDENAPLIIVPVTSYDHAFAAMLAWEGMLNADLSPMFTAVPVLKADANGLPTKRTFQDLVMRNHDVRALKDDGGKIQLYYSFPTQNILVIAESPYSFTEILSRLQAGRQL